MSVSKEIVDNILLLFTNQDVKNVDLAKISIDRLINVYSKSLSGGADERFALFELEKRNTTFDSWVKIKHYRSFSKINQLIAVNLAKYCSTAEEIVFTLEFISSCGENSFLLYRRVAEKLGDFDLALSSKLDIYNCFMLSGYSMQEIESISFYQKIKKDLSSDCTIADWRVFLRGESFCIETLEFASVNINNIIKKQQNKFEFCCSIFDPDADLNSIFDKIVFGILLDLASSFKKVLKVLELTYISGCNSGFFYSVLEVAKTIAVSEHQKLQILFIYNDEEILKEFMSNLKKLSLSTLTYLLGKYRGRECWGDIFNVWIKQETRGRILAEKLLEYIDYEIIVRKILKRLVGLFFWRLRKK